MTGASNWTYLAAVVLLFSGGLLLALRLTLRRRTVQDALPSGRTAEAKRPSAHWVSSGHGQGR